ncbi:class I SAM-dependent methyltransferase [Azospirillum sp.]|uniref:class I SAM-dependent methyltransferase n=1 Tax=Azospirillum sp. TaxID=34012 RepID=UPI003D75FBB7
MISNAVHPDASAAPVGADTASPAPVRVQYGCGWSVQAGWQNFDASPTLRFEKLPLIGRLYVKNAAPFPDGARFGDIVKGLPFPDSTVDCVYASHVLEHLSYQDCRRALRNTYRMLKPGGTFRLVVPDLQWRAAAYLQALAAGDRQAATAFMRSTLLGVEERPRGLFGWLGMLFGNSAHLWMWDEASLTDALKEAGFATVRRCRFGDADIADFAMVEEKSRFYEGDQAELALEARKG